MEPSQQLFQIGGGYMLAAALWVVVDAGVADHLGAGPKSVAELAKATGTNEDALYRILRLLASAGVFEETGPRTFRLTPAAELLQKNHPRSMRDLVHFIADPFHFRVYANLDASLKTGRPAAEKTVGGPIFEYLAKNPEYSEIFNRAMTGLSASIVPAALEAYDFGGIGTLVDVAGGHGELLMTVLKKYPAMRGILMDLDHVLAGAKPRIAAAGLAGRLQTASGDFFTAVPSGGDAYIMKHIIHDWDDARAGQILTNVNKAMGATKGRVILLESVIQPGNAPDTGKVMDIEMLAFPGGRERTADEFRALFQQAGFELTSITPTHSPVCAIEARKL
ncbi:MAG TPA: methyltransferase [Vicinamibacterales bacterium]|nr:methyltransferase [Vicinamibacterales bacterium]